MRVKQIIIRILLQAALTQLFVFVYNFAAFQSLEMAAMSTAALVLFIGIYGGTLGILLLGRGGGISKILAVSFLTSLLVTLTFIIYPGLGLVVEWYILFGLLFISGLIAHGLVYETPQKEEVR